MGFSLNPGGQESKIKASTGLCPYKDSVGELIFFPFPASGGCQHPLICNITISLPASKVSLQPLFCICQFSLSPFLIRTSLMAFLSYPHHTGYLKILNLISPTKAFLQIREKKIQSRDQDIDASVGRGACQFTTEVEAHWRIKQ